MKQSWRSLLDRTFFVSIFGSLAFLTWCKKSEDTSQAAVYEARSQDSAQVRFVGRTMDILRSLADTGAQTRFALSDTGNGSAEDRFFKQARCDRPEPGTIRGLLEGRFIAPVSDTLLDHALIMLRNVDADTIVKTLETRQQATFRFHHVRRPGHYAVVVWHQLITEPPYELAVGNLADLEKTCILPSTGRVPVSRRLLAVLRP